MQKIKVTLVLFALIVVSATVFGQSSVIISQYIETNSGTTPKGIEIFNVSGSAIDFSSTNLVIYQGTNGGSCGSIVSVTSGTLAADEVLGYWNFEPY